MAYRLIGKDFTPPDLEAKVTGRAKYAEDFRADGMAFVRILASPMPHAEVKKVDLSKAMKVPGFLVALTPDEVKQPAAPGQPILSAESRRPGGRFWCADACARHHNGPVHPDRGYGFGRRLCDAGRPRRNS